MLKTVRGAGYVLAARGAGLRGLSRTSHPRLFWRVYLAGLALLAPGGASRTSSSGAVTGRGPLVRGTARLTRYAAEHIAEPPRRPGARSRPSCRADGATPSRWTWPTGSTTGGVRGQRRASRPRSPADRRARLDDGLPAFTSEDDRPVLGHARARAARPGYLVVAGSRPGPSRSSGPAAFISAWLLVLALASFPLARAHRRAPSSGSPRRPGRSARATSRPAPGCGRGDEVGELSRAFDDMAGAPARRLVRSERQLLADVSHELRTPLARIRVALDLAAEGDVDRARRTSAEIGRRPRGARPAARRRPHRRAARLRPARAAGEVPLRLEQASGPGARRPGRRAVPPTATRAGTLDRRRRGGPLPALVGRPGHAPARPRQPARQRRSSTRSRRRADRSSRRERRAARLRGRGARPGHRRRPARPAAPLHALLPDRPQPRPRHRRRRARAGAREADRRGPRRDHRGGERARPGDRRCASRVPGRA